MKSRLLDTNIISEWRKPRPNRRVTAFLEAQARSNLYASAACFAELRRGAQLTKDLRNRQVLENWIEGELREYFTGKILDLTEDLLLIALDVVDKADKARRGVSQVYLWVAATAIYHGFVVVTRNTRDIVRTGAPLFSPWTGERFNGA